MKLSDAKKSDPTLYAVKKLSALIRAGKATMSTASATEIQIETIRAQRVDNTAREMMTEGVTLSHEQADSLGEECIGWLSSRLGLSVSETDSAVVCTPR